MILILSEKDDTSTSDVIDWLIGLGANPVRINAGDRISSLKLITSPQIDFKFNIDEKVYTYSEIESFWFRRGFFTVDKKVKLDCDETTKVLVNTHLNNEADTLKEFLYFNLALKPSLGNKLTDKVNKLIALQKAMEFGLKIPETIITTTSERLNESLPLITKGIHSVACIQINDQFYGNYTEEITEEEIAKDEFFYPSLFQEKIDKKYEIRIFYIKGEFFSSCIFSQLDTQTSVDFRKYNLKKPNRVVPYSLPMEVTEKLQNLMDFFKLKTASIDVVVNTRDEYIFLEINPVGQFGMVSYPCNYYLEEKIAKYLMNNL